MIGVDGKIMFRGGAALAENLSALIEQHLSEREQ